MNPVCRSRYTRDRMRQRFAAFLAPLIGPAAPLVTAGIVGPAIVAQLAVVSAQQPPKLHGGTSNSDEVLATVRSGEAVMSQRGAESIGRDNIDAANNGNGGSAGGVIQNAIVFRNRTIDKMVSETIRSGGATRNIIRAGRRPGVVDPFGGI